MKTFHDDIDKVGEEVAVLLDRMHDEYRALGIDASADYVKGCTWIVFLLASDYYRGARAALLNGDIISGGSLVRTQLENAADLFYILRAPDKTEKYAKAYVESITAFRSAMALAALRGRSGAIEARALKQVNPWTRSHIQDRLISAGPAIAFTYDMLSYFSHPNPGSVDYIIKPRLKKAQINILKQANVVNALQVIGLTLNHSDLKSVTIEEADILARQLGVSLIPE